jgi:hypothetical protein
LVRDSEVNDVEGLFIPLTPLVIFLLNFLACCVDKFGVLVIYEFSFVFSHLLWMRMLAVDHLSDFFLRKQYVALEQPVLVVVVVQLFDPISASMRILE